MPEQSIRSTKLPTVSDPKIVENILLGGWDSAKAMLSWNSLEGTMIRGAGLLLGCLGGGGIGFILGGPPGAVTGCATGTEVVGGALAAELGYNIVSAVVSGVNDVSELIVAEGAAKELAARNLGQNATNLAAIIFLKKGGRKSSSLISLQTKNGWVIDLKPLSKLKDGTMVYGLDRNFSSAMNKGVSQLRPMGQGIMGSRLEKLLLPSVSSEFKTRGKQIPNFDFEANPELKGAVEMILGYYGLALTSDLRSPDGIALVCNLVNWYSKTVDDQYWVKDNLMIWLAENHPSARTSRYKDILYVETAMGQVSFHIMGFDAVHDVVQTGGSPVWDGAHVQPDSPRLVNWFQRINRGDHLAEVEFERWLREF